MRIRSRRRNGNKTVHHVSSRGDVAIHLERNVVLDDTDNDGKSVMDGKCVIQQHGRRRRTTEGRRQEAG